MERLLVSVFLGIVLVAGIGALAIINTAETGAYVTTVKYISCHYKDEDLHGGCVRIVKQLGTSCDPPQDRLLRDWDSGYGWLARPCVPAFSSERF